MKLVLVWDLSIDKIWIINIDDDDDMMTIVMKMIESIMCKICAKQKNN